MIYMSTNRLQEQDLMTEVKTFDSKALENKRRHENDRSAGRY